MYYSPSTVPPSWEPVFLLYAFCSPWPSYGGPQPVIQEILKVCQKGNNYKCASKHNDQPCWAWYALTVFQANEIYHHINSVSNVVIVYLVSQHLRSGLLCLLLVDELHQNSLVLEHISLSLEVQLVIQMTVNLLGLSVKFKKNLIVNSGKSLYRLYVRILNRFTKLVHLLVTQNKE